MGIARGACIPEARIAVVGAGALGCGVLPRLLHLPVSTLTVVDGDRVEEHNLDRQELYAHVDIGRPKAAVAASWLRHAPKAVHVQAVDAFLSAANADELVSGQDIVVDLTDDVHVRRLIDRTCARHGVALVSGAVHGTQGQVMVLHAPGDDAHIGLPDLFHGVPASEQDGCDMRQVPAASIEAVTARVAFLVRQVMQGVPGLNGRIDVHDPARGGWITLNPPVTRSA